jgi:hypothetical protein
VAPAPVPLLARFSSKLRKQLLAVTEQLAAKELELAQLHEQ